MRFLIISHAEHKVNNNHVYAYAPYVREMNLWLKYVDEVAIIAPKVTAPINAIDLVYEHDNLVLRPVPAIQFTRVKHAVRSVLLVPGLFFKVLIACKRADHIHLRCPGNMGLLGCVAQVFFPKKIKTAKYAGNWDPGAQQPLSYRFQKWVLSNPILTKNMQVLVYGDWPNKTKNVKPFFTATYSETEIETTSKRDYTGNLTFVFLGSLVIGKRPLLAIQIIEKLHKQGKQVTLELYGEGPLKSELERYIQENNISAFVTLKGNQTKAVVKQALKEAHFSILPSRSEGWPKAIAEAMFFGAIPIVTKISCVPYMLNKGKRGLLIAPNVDTAVHDISKALENTEVLQVMSEAALEWSQTYTLDTFEHEIAKLVQSEK